MIPITRPKITNIETKYVDDAIRNGWGKNCFNYIEQFKEKLINFLKVEKTWLTTSCHGALHTVLMTIGIKGGDEVIVPDYTWIGSANPVKWLGGTVVGCDINLEDACISPIDFEKKITEKTKAVIVVHLYGNVANLKEICKIAAKKNIYVIEDCAGAFGSEYNGERVGTIGDFGAFSFNATKMITTGEGGAIVAKHKKFHEKITLISDQGRDRNSKDTYEIKELGLKYNITNIQAALGLGQLERFKQIYNRKKEIFEIYKEKFIKNEKFLLHNLEKNNNKNNFWLPTILFKEGSANLDDLVKHVNKNGANIRRNIYTLSMTKPYYGLGNFPNSKYAAKNSVNLCSFEDIKNSEVEKICNLINNFTLKS